MLLTLIFFVEQMTVKALVRNVKVDMLHNCFTYLLVMYVNKYQLKKNLVSFDDSSNSTHHWCCEKSVFYFGTRLCSAMMFLSF